MSEKNGRIIGQQEKFDQREVAFTRLGMGKLGEKSKEQWLGESPDPLWRLFYGYTRKENSLVNHLRQVVDGPVKPEKTLVDDTHKMSKQIKKIAKFIGAHLCGITHLNQYYVYSHRGRNTDLEDGRFGEEIIINHKYAIVIGYAMDYDLVKTSPSYSADAETGRVYAEVAKIAVMLAAYIRELGYPALAHHFRQDEVIHPPLAVAAGLGELGRNGYVVNPLYGPRFRTAVITTDLPLEVDAPIDIGVSEFCEICKKCATHCPVTCIPKGEKAIKIGVEKWVIESDLCMKFWASNPKRNLSCVTCMSVCPYNKKNTWYHRIAVKAVSQSKLARHLLLLIDDIFYGK